MPKLEMILHQFNPFLLPSALLNNLRNTDWQEAQKHHGVLGLFGATFGGLTGLNTWPFFVDGNSRWSKGDIARLLSDHGVACWSWGATPGGEWHFLVRRKQAHWAEYVMIRAGVPVTGRLLTGGSPTEQDADSAMAAASRATPRSQDSTVASPSSASAKRTISSRNPIDAINDVADSLGDWLAR